MKNILQPAYKGFVRFIKKCDALTRYKVGNVFRRWTNVNTRSYWDQYLKERGGQWRDFPYLFLMDELPKNEKFSLLDIGCALGEGCALLKKHFPLADIQGADLSPLAIEQAKAKYRCGDYFCLDLNTQDPPRKYDYITLIHILEHFDEPYAVIDRCLKFVNRAVYISTPYEEHFDNPRLYWKGEHRYLFNEKSFGGYRCTVVSITDFIPAVGSRHIRYKIVP